MLEPRGFRRVQRNVDGPPYAVRGKLTLAVVECCIDIANHVIASEGYRFPKDNADSFVVLIERAILDSGLRDALGGMARFRNRLVHLYWDVDDQRVYEFLQEGLGDIERFGNTMARREW